MSSKYMRALEAKLTHQSAEDLKESSSTVSGTEGPSGSKASSTSRPIFQGLRIYVNGYTSGTTRTEITRVVNLHGGKML